LPLSLQILNCLIIRLRLRLSINLTPSEAADFLKGGYQTELRVRCLDERRRFVDVCRARNRVRDPDYRTTSVRRCVAWKQESIFAKLNIVADGPNRSRWQVAPGGRPARQIDEIALCITRHNKWHIVELSNGSNWRI
jgi:hypothetical protein